MRGRQRCLGNDSAALPSLSILPRRKNERCGRRTEGVMVKRSDGTKKRKEKTKKQEMALGGLQKKQGLHDKSRGNVSEKVKLQKSKEKEWGREEKEDKRWRFNELSLTVGDMRSSPRLKRIKGEVCTFIQALKQFPHAGWGKPGVVFRLETAIPNVHTCTINLWNKKRSLRVMKMLHLTAAYPLIAAQTDFSLSSLRNYVLYSYSLHSSGRPLIRSFVIMWK